MTSPVPGEPCPVAPVGHPAGSTVVPTTGGEMSEQVSGSANTAADDDARAWATALLWLGGVAAALSVVGLVALIVQRSRPSDGPDDWGAAILLPLVVVALVSVAFVAETVSARREADAGHPGALRVLAVLAMPLGVMGALALVMLAPPLGILWLAACLVVPVGVLSSARRPRPSAPESE